MYINNYSYIASIVFCIVLFCYLSIHPFKIIRLLRYEHREQLNMRIDIHISFLLRNKILNLNS